MKLFWLLVICKVCSGLVANGNGVADNATAIVAFQQEYECEEKWISHKDNCYRYFNQDMKNWFNAELDCRLMVRISCRLLTRQNIRR